MQSIQFFTLPLKVNHSAKTFHGALIFGNQNRCELLRIIPPFPESSQLFEEVSKLQSEEVREKIVFHKHTKKEIFDQIKHFCHQGMPLMNIFTSELVTLENFSAFRKESYRQASFIPHGETQSYMWIASKVSKTIGSANPAPRAVGQAMKKNSFPLLIPCHRVLQKNGKMGGFMGTNEQESWQLALKRTLLQLESVYRQPELFSNKIVTYNRIMA